MVLFTSLPTLFIGNAHAAKEKVTLATHEHFFFEELLLNYDLSVKSGQIFSWTYSKHEVQLCSYYRRYTVEWLLRA